MMNPEFECCDETSKIKENNSLTMQAHFKKMLTAATELKQMISKSVGGETEFLMHIPGRTLKSAQNCSK